MTVLSLVIIVSALLLPAVMASSDLHPHVRAYVQQRDLVLRDASPTTTAGIVGVPIVVSQSPSPTTKITGQVGVPLNQPGTTATSTNGGIVGTPPPHTPTTSSEEPESTEAPEPDTTSTEIPTLTPIVPIVGTPKATSLSSSTPTVTGIKGSSLSSSPQVTSSHAPPGYAVAIVVVFSGIIFFSFVGLIFWRLRMYRNVNRKQKDLEDEDAMEAYSKYWKGKRNSGGASEKGESTTSSAPVEEKST